MQCLNHYQFSEMDALRQLFRLFQLTKIPFPVLAIMVLAIINGIITSIILETIILLRQNFSLKLADDSRLIPSSSKIREIKVNAKNIKSDRLAFIMSKLESFLDKNEI